MEFVHCRGDFYYLLHVLCMVKAEARRGAGASASSGLDVLQLSLVNSLSRVMHLHRIHFALPVSIAVFITISLQASLFR